MLEISIMMSHRILLSVVFSLCLIGLATGASSSRAQTYSQLTLDATGVPWSSLTYRARSFRVDADVDIHVEYLSAGDVEAALIEARRGAALQVPVQGACKLSNYMVFDIIGRPPIKIVNHVWFDPEDATALGRFRLRRGEDDFKKIYRFTQQGVFRHRIEPRDQQEARQEPENWTDVRDTFYAYNLDQLGCVNVSERLLLIYIISAVKRLEDNKPLVLCVFAKRQLFQVKLESAGLHSVKYDYIEKNQQAKKHRKGRVDAHKIILETRPLKSDLQKVENFSLFNFHKNIAFFIHPTSKLPLQISGEFSKAGKATVKLHKVQLR